MIINRRAFSALTMALLITPGCHSAPTVAHSRRSTGKAAKLIAAARTQIGVTVNYDPAYTSLAFPNGDVPWARGVCTDVVIRAYRDAFAVDLQSEVNAAMRRDFQSYPKIWGLPNADKNIDHRRVPNLMVFLKQNNAALPVSQDPNDWQPGDIFTSLIGGRLPHIGIVSDRMAGKNPMVIHNIGAGTREENMLFAHKLTGHFRWQLA